MTHTNNHHEPVVFDNRDIARYEPGERRMAMRGFEAEYTDIVDYIVRITHRILRFVRISGSSAAASRFWPNTPCASHTAKG
jgi:hypothetical protein